MDRAQRVQENVRYDTRSQGSFVVLMDESGEAMQIVRETFGTADIAYVPP